jgi:hypothetical protein
MRKICEPQYYCSMDANWSTRYDHKKSSRATRFLHPLKRAITSLSQKTINHADFMSFFISNIIQLAYLRILIALRRAFNRVCLSVNFKNKKAPKKSGLLNLIRRRPTLPHRCQCSTIGAGGLNFRVRDGNGCNPSARVTGRSCRHSLCECRL